MPDAASLVGQDILLRSLRRAVQRDQLAHALIFQGEEGLGSEAAAWALARILLCQQGGPEPCEACSGCRKSRRLDHPDLYVVMPLPSLPAGQEELDPAVHFADKYVAALAAWAANPLLPPRPDFERDKESESVRHRQIQVAQARYLKKWAALRPFEGRHRVAIVVEAERMGVQTQNALLKLLEEPPEQLILLLCTPHPETLLPTIRSRCQSLNLRPVPLDRLAEWLEAHGAAAAAGLSARELAQLAGGNPGRALKLAEERGEGDEEDVWQPAGFLRDVLATHSDGLFQRVNAMDAARNRERVRRFLGDLQTWLLDAELVRRLGPEARERVFHADQFDDLERFSARVGLERPDVVLEQLSEAQRLCERNAHTFTLLLTLAHFLRRECVAYGRKQTA